MPSVLLTFDRQSSLLKQQWQKYKYQATTSMQFKFNSQLTNTQKLLKKKRQNRRVPSLQLDFFNIVSKFRASSNIGSQAQSTTLDMDREDKVVTLHDGLFKKYDPKSAQEEENQIVTDGLPEDLAQAWSLPLELDETDERRRKLIEPFDRT